jgi:hypothetical protein
MNHSIFFMLPWFLATFVIGGMYITAAVLLLKERHFSAWLMLAGSCIALIGQMGPMFFRFVMVSSANFKPEHLLAISAFGSLGALLFAIGLLLHALHQRSKSNRIQELEAILASLQKP